MITVSPSGTRPRYRIALAAATIAVLSCLTACSTAAPPATSASSGPASGGTLRMTLPADEGCVDPQQNLGRSQLAIGRALADSLVYQDPKSGKFEPWLASSWKISSDGLSYTFSLRKGVTFSDKSALTAKTIKDNLDAIVALGAKARLASTYLAGYTGTDVVNSLTARVNFSAPNASFLQATSTASLGILSDPSTALSQADRCLGKASGSGPFTLKSYVQNQSQTLVRRASYDWAPTGMHKGPAYVSEVDATIVPQSSVRVGSLSSGQSDLMMEVAQPDVATLDAANLITQSRSNPGVPQELFVNPKSGPLSDTAVRQAIQIGIDRKKIVASTLTKYNTVATGALSATTPGYINLSSQLAYNPSKANSILTKAGWIKGSDGIRSKDGQRLTVSLLYGSMLYGPLVPLMELVQSDLAKIGVQVTLRPLPDVDANADWAKGDFQLRLSGLTRGDPDALRTAYFGLNPQLDALLTKQATTNDIPARLKVVEEAEKFIISQGIAIPINELSLPLAHTKNVHNISYTGDSLLLLHEISLSK